ncbi:2-C-methyl-D-erythritol 4-phosphate cytidylyltransferase [Sphaerotilus microaerophilus]|nr:2-C-methyl-D-erythritol 4-phosphate cytidylyltransferase [Sphaerotilus sp. FB-5]
MNIAIGLEPRCFALVPCAGVGVRAGVGGPKQYHPLAGRAVVAHTLAALRQVRRLSATLVVLSPDDDRFEAVVPEHLGEQAWVARCGGASRAETVANGLAALAARGVQPHDWVLVHDAARCLLQPAWVDRLIDACQDDEVGGLLALPVADTLKQEVDGRAVATVPRAGKWAAQTPQMFRLGLLRPALVSAGEAVTDEASAVEALGHAPRLVRGDTLNLKVTWPEDFRLAERLLHTATMA